MPSLPTSTASFIGEKQVMCSQNWRLSPKMQFMSLIYFICDPGVPIAFDLQQTALNVMLALGLLFH